MYYARHLQAYYLKKLKNLPIKVIKDELNKLKNISLNDFKILQSLRDLKNMNF